MYRNDNIQKTVLRVFREQLCMFPYLSKNKMDITVNTKIKDFFRKNGFTSLDTIELIMALEGEFFIQITQEKFDNFVTIQDIINYIEQKTN